ncbi:diacylglyceryl transferase [Flavobacterium branchiophilum NBRC 15030 = ATCC 35035]|uniref:Diacylglyceryl transferase n=2 Tax=Flavobacterium branchiophilum TaxID=55197 RepID=A0A2H3K8N5_9FLAO|nr:DUF6787 family protein [Flavobacterium branchiophilum]OXA72288.1 diacylglyceryl transferase [Flavobacterium branchiophilum NBRC 15030 = ATCC 35035]PDS22131.1 diacylglyceryl transferase [Flavobacterium branchiophilum]TQM41965.1 hypothetical protein BC670_2983 [Flavobacterium branchiophilum]CCB69527.1 Hypothetical transmembrane protein [Flavobacterium branchiophilum FL-15]GEM55063.1 hypothetical protein FB1_12840 [Flavobacterium branchiophilum NBRC 15030 = ATCC 35035]
MEKFKQKWRIRSNVQLAIIVLVFAINGSLSAKIALFVLDRLGLSIKELPAVLYYVVLFLIVLPFYPYLLKVVGFVFGQSSFFNPIANKMLEQYKKGIRKWIFFNRK